MRIYSDIDQYISIDDSTFENNLIQIIDTPVWKDIDGVLKWVATFCIDEEFDTIPDKNTIADKVISFMLKNSFTKLYEIRLVTITNQLDIHDPKTLLKIREYDPSLFKYCIKIRCIDPFESKINIDNFPLQ